MNTSYDKEYTILNQIDATPEATQRDLSRHTGLSLGSVNLLLKKMVKEGFIKMETIPANRVIYMLTPKGMMEKANKTIQYVKVHYNAINQTKEKIKHILEELLEHHTKLYVLVGNDEMGILIVSAVEEHSPERTTIIKSFSEVANPTLPILYCHPEQKPSTTNIENDIINLMEKL